MYGVVNQQFPRANRLVTAPEAEPVTAAELVSYARQTTTGLPSAEAHAVISQARNYLEQMTGLALIDQTWRLTLDAWPGYYEEWWDGVRQGTPDLFYTSPKSIIIPRYPLSSITSLTTYDTASNSTAVTVSDYFDTDTASIRGRLTLKSGAVWPTATRPTNAIEIVYVSGFGSSAYEVPHSLKRAVLVLAGYLFEHRSECEAGEAYKKSGAAEMVAAYAVKTL